jgi:hypothetical protein
MTVGCIGETIALVSAWPNDGYRLVVVDDGPDRVHVKFEGDDDGAGGALAAVCRDGAPVDHDDRARGRDGGDVDEDDDHDNRGRSGRGERFDDDDPGPGRSGDDQQGNGD